MYSGTEEKKTKLNIKKKLNKSYTLCILIAVLILILVLAIFIHNLTSHLTPATEHPGSKEIANLLKSSATYKIVQIAKGDTLTKILQAEGLDNKTTLAILNASKGNDTFKKLQFNQELRLLVTVDTMTQKKTLLELQVALNPAEILIFRKIDDKYQLIKSETALSTKIEYGSIILQTNIAAAIEKAKLPKILTHKLNTIFNYKINFSRDVHPGDKFIIKYAARYDGNKLIDVLKIIAAEIQSKKAIYQAISFQDSSGNENYYTAQGKSLQQNFLRWPIVHGRISSPFTLGRIHPILGVIRPHKGTDFAAPYGTPIRATGDGIVTLAKATSGYGRTLIINNGNGYNTLFAHLSRYAKNIYVGSRVKQGQTVGYIGTSGLSTGPHLHYEFHVNGQAHDPMRVKLPSVKSLPATEMRRFLPYAEQQLTDLVQYGGKGKIDKINAVSLSTATKKVSNKNIKAKY